MKKEDAILKVNKLGNISNIIVRIMKIIVIIGLILTVAGTILVMALPKDLIKMDLGETVDLTIDVSAFGVELDEEGKEEMLEGFYDEFYEEDANVSMNLNGSEYEAVKAEVNDNGMVVEMAVDAYTIEFRDLGIVCALGVVTLVALLITLIFAGKLCKAFRDCESPFEENVVKQLNALAFSLLPWVVLDSLTESVTESIFTNTFNLFIGVDLGMVMIIFFIFVLAYIFKYGAVLQQESDETL